MTDVAAFFPLTARHLGAPLPPAKTPDELVRALSDAYARGDIPSRAVRDLARYEALLLELKPTSVAPAPPPRDDERLVLAPYARLLVYGAALPDMLAALREGKPATPRPARGWIAMWKDAEGRLHELILVREDGWLLETFREGALVADAVDDEDDRQRVAEFVRLGILVRA